MMNSVIIEKLTPERIMEAANLIYRVYQEEKIWLTYTMQQIYEDISAAFVNNKNYRPIYFIALVDNKIIGIAGYSESFMSSEGFELSFNTILPQYQRQGIGTKLTIIRIKEIIEKEPNAVIFTRARRPKMFLKMNFKYIHKSLDNDGIVGEYDYMFCPVKDIEFPLM